jgi:hypothetical protein
VLWIDGRFTIGGATAIRRHDEHALQQRGPPVIGMPVPGQPDFLYSGRRLAIVMPLRTISVEVSRGDRIRTCDVLVPNQVL